jgi:hypothetical protein
VCVRWDIPYSTLLEPSAPPVGAAAKPDFSNPSEIRMAHVSGHCIRRVHRPFSNADITATFIFVLPGAAEWNVARLT